MQSKNGRALRTRVYIDGFNLYYGCLNKTVYKWLDVRTLVQRILSNVPYEREGELIAHHFVSPAIKYFTAPILKPFAKSDDSMSCQRNYYNALIGHLGTELEIIYGFYDARPARAHRWEVDKPALECDRVEVWKLEEKQSDVALALHAYSDAARNDIDQVVVLTNDSDFEPAMQMIRRDTAAIIGVIAPIEQQRGNINLQLQKHAHWTRRGILHEEIAQSQLPHTVRLREGVVHKPLSWYPRPDLLIPIFEEAKRVRGSAGAARKWLNQPCVHLSGRIPIAMCERDDTANELRQYMDLYAQAFGLTANR